MPIRLSHDGLTETERHDQVLWFKAEVDWPIEKVCLELEVGSPTELTPLEWAVLRILVDFDGAAGPARINGQDGWTGAMSFNQL